MGQLCGALADEPGGNAGYMERMPSQPCWQGRHWLFAGASVVTIALLYPVMIHFERKRQSAAEVSYHVRFTACMLIGKLALSACSALLVSVVPPTAYLLCCMGMLVFFLHINNQREQDSQPACCNVHTVRRLRSLLLTCALWTASTTLASTVLDMPEWCFLAGLGVLWLLTAVFYITVIVYPQREPTYQSEPPVIDGFKAAFVASPPGQRLFAANDGHSGHDAAGTPSDHGSSAAPQALLAPAVAAALPHQLPFRGRVLTARLPSGGSGLDPGQLDLGAECGNRICKCGSCSSSLVGGARGIPEVPQ